jgi:hypothetical protein
MKTKKPRQANRDRINSSKTKARALCESMGRVAATLSGDGRVTMLERQIYEN